MDRRPDSIHLGENAHMTQTTSQAHCSFCGVEQSPATPPLALTPEAAQAFQQSQQAGAFAIVKLSLRDYQQAWITARHLQEVAPNYGFIDYSRRQVILPQRSEAV
jgi:hypothetical protein